MSPGRRPATEQIRLDKDLMMSRPNVHFIFYFHFLPTIKGLSRRCYLFISILLILLVGLLLQISHHSNNNCDDVAILPPPVDTIIRMYLSIYLSIFPSRPGSHAYDF